MVLGLQSTGPREQNVRNTI